MSKQTTAPRRSRDEWRTIITGQEASGESASAWCRRRRLPEKSFYYWRKRLSGGADAQPEAFIRLTAAATGSAKTLRIQTPNGYCLEVPQGMDGAYVQCILTVLAAL